MGGEKSGPGWGLTTWVLGTPGGLRWAEYGGGYADPEGCRTDFPPSPAPALGNHFLLSVSVIFHEWNHTVQSFVNCLQDLAKCS